VTSECNLLAFPVFIKKLEVDDVDDKVNVCIV